MRHAPYVLILALALIFTGCYHARIETGQTPGDQVIDQPWAVSWVYGLVPPETVEAGQQCQAGVAVVETRLSFLNQVVAAITFGIFTPMHITVTCAQGGTALMEAPETRLFIPEDANLADIQETFDAAAEEAVTNHERVIVQFSEGTP